MKIKELLKLPFFQRCVFKNFYNKQELLGDYDEIKDIYEIAVEEGEPCKKPTHASTTGFFLLPTYYTVVYCIKKEEE